jgi:hypothetical protein
MNTNTLLRAAALLAITIPGAGCNDEANAEASSGFDSDSQGNETAPGEWMESGDDGNEPPEPGDASELCDAGNEAWAKRTIQFIQGRRPEGVREARLIAQMVTQLDALDVDGRRTVAMGLARGDIYLDRWKQWIYEQLRINVSADRRNELCYDRFGAESDSTALAEFIRDNPAAQQYGSPFRLGDVVYSSLLLDDITPAYRADLYARHSAPMIAGNVTHAELETANVGNYGKIFESSYLGRFTECMDCHRAEMSVTDAADPEFDRHWPLPGNVELATYGPTAAMPDAAKAHAVFRHFGFSTTSWLSPADPIPSVGEPVEIDPAPPEGNDLAWGMDADCGEFRFDAGEEFTLLQEPGYMIAEYPLGATVVQLDDHMREGFQSLVDDGLALGDDGTVLDQNVGFAWLYSANIANRVWREAMGYPLTVANNFPRNETQRDVMQGLAEAFSENQYSLRNLVASVTTNPYYNQQTPDVCGATTAYHMPAIFDPFTKGSSDPTARGNGVGDSLHRFSAMVLLDSLSRAMWWDLPQRFGPSEDPDEQAGLNCGAGLGGVCNEAPVLVDFLRDSGVFLNDSESGYNGVDFTGLLHWELRTAQGQRIAFDGDCTGPLGSGCADVDYITQLVGIAATSGGTMRDVAAAIKDRLITESGIDNSGEAAAIAGVMGMSLDTPCANVAAADMETAARRYAGVLLNSPQFLLAGAPSRDQDPANDPILVVPGTSMQALCEVLGEQVLGSDYTWSCSADGITISG